MNLSKLQLARIGSMRVLGPHKYSSDNIVCALMTHVDVQPCWFHSITLISNSGSNS